jgi:hypothetical protein
MLYWRLVKASNASILVAWLCLATVVSVPYVLATFDPPLGRVFVGTFHWIDDYSNYLSFAQQAEDGQFLFENKLDLSPHDGELINLEWWCVGLLSRVLGRRPFLAFRIWAVLVLVGLFTSVDRELRRGGLPGSVRLPALLLVGFGGGLGGGSLRVHGATRLALCRPRCRFLSVLGGTGEPTLAHGNVASVRVAGSVLTRGLPST